MNYKHNKEKVIQKGVELFWVKGYHSLGVNEICEETGMTKGAFYNTFKSKEKFLLTTIASYGDIIVSHLQAQLSGKKTSAFYSLVTLYKNMLLAQTSNNYMGCLVNNMMSEMGTSYDAVAAMAAKQFKRFLMVIEPAVKEAQEAGDFDNNISSECLAEIIHTTFFGFLTRSKSTKTTNHEAMTSFFNILKNR
ncbi:TetR/AcrR family transcriptional regulator [Aquimarina gracilis]|uniref:TetR/AcrR family transcriptional regulator n=1 Tax=Aquimarina gracilis TaxID=874422 RepID=A0ABU5ZSQ0_9FLAO|nr:TetR/AcrR family transcriptional regulator [Aquimarina gracilis]MEB3345090.1 TetR/AcrR family transcriptional regulator [Aquimarina gracilis]